MIVSVRMTAESCVSVTVTGARKGEVSVSRWKASLMRKTPAFEASAKNVALNPSSLQRIRVVPRQLANVSDTSSVRLSWIRTVMDGGNANGGGVRKSARARM